MSIAETPPRGRPTGAPQAAGTGPPGLAARLRLAGLALFWERLVPRLWPALAVLGLFLVLAFLDLFRDLPGWLHGVLLIAFAGVLAASLWHALRGFERPDHAAARRRLEQASGFAHRPLAALADHLAAGEGDPAAIALWRLHRERMALASRPLRVGVPAGGLVAVDPYGLRAALVLVLVVAAVGAGGAWQDRLLRALTPSLGGGPPAAPPSLDIWVTPPDYTGLAPLFLGRDRADTAIAVPVGSTVLAQVHGGNRPPELAVDAARVAFAKIDALNFTASSVLRAGHRLTVRQDGTTLGAWPIRIIPDLPPTVTFAERPMATANHSLKLEYQAADDYGLAGVTAVITRAGGPPDETITLDLPLPGPHPRAAKAASFHDLTPHVWAGLPVEIRLVARDAIGQTGNSAPMALVLPERSFHNPVARAIIEQRKELTRDPTERQPVAEILSDLASRPGLFHDDALVFLALRDAAARLMLDPAPTAVAATQQLMWNAALRIEDGGVALAQTSLRRLEDRLQGALARQAPDAEIDALMQQLQRALDRYLDALAKQMQGMEAGQAQRLPPLDPAQALSRDDLQKMLDRARELARTGDRDAARQLLSQLQEMLENLRAGRLPPQTAEGRALQQMQGLMQRQQQLLDRSFRNAQPGRSAQSDADARADAAQQEALRRMLGEMMRQLGDTDGGIPQALGRAERAMRDAGEALGRNAPGSAVAPQGEALDQLQQAARDMARQMAGRTGEGSGDSKESGGAGRRLARDPLGRDSGAAAGGSPDDSAVRIPQPGEGELQRSRAILDELRRRSGQWQRPEPERDYIDRLLKQF